MPLSLLNMSAGIIPAALSSTIKSTPLRKPFWATLNDLQFKHIYTRQTLHIPY